MFPWPHGGYHIRMHDIDTDFDGSCAHCTCFCTITMQCASQITSTDLPCRPVGSIVIVCKKKKEQIECQELPEDSDLMLVILVYGQH